MNNRNDEIYFECKKALLSGDIEELRKFGRQRASDILQEESQMRMKDATDATINHAKEQSWIAEARK